MRKPQVVFFGSGPVAAESLLRLAAYAQIEVVITKPRPTHHRGEVPVLDAAKTLGLPVLTAASGAALDELVANQAFNSKLAVLVDFGIIVSQHVIDAFPLGIVNSHFSLLPQWRGADPITFSVLSGQTKTGVSLILLVAALDEGPLLAQGEYDMASDVTTPQLTSALIELSDRLLEDILPSYLAGDITPAPQLEATILEDKTPSYSRRLTKEDGMIDWGKSAAQLEREVRAYAGWPKSYGSIGDIDVVITRASVVKKQGVSGAHELHGRQLLVYCGQDALSIERLKPTGKPEMDAAAFINGYRSRL